jgi:hypothetical protein
MAYPLGIGGNGSKQILTHRSEYVNTRNAFDYGKARVDYALADLAQVTGAKRRSLQLWADAGVIRAEKSTDRGGSGTHRRFSRDEAIIACIVHGFALHQIAIGELLIISGKVRGALTDQRKKPILAAMRGDESWMLVYSSWMDDISDGNEPGPMMATLSDVTAQRVRNGVIKLPLYVSLDEGFVAVICLATYLSKLGELENSA